MKSWILRALYAGATLASLDISAAHSAEIYYDPRSQAMAIEGILESGDEKKFLDAIKDSERHTGMTPSFLYLDSGGGDFEAGMKIAFMVHVADMVAIVAPKRQCVSMCMTIFAAADTRTYSNHASLGVHSLADYVGDINNAASEDTANARALTTKLARLWREWGVPSTITGYMVTTEPSDVHWLKTSEIDQDWAGVYTNPGRPKFHINPEE